MGGPFEKLRELFRVHHGWTGPNLMPLDFACCCYLSPFLPGDARNAWGELIGPPSSGKTEIIKTFLDGGKRTLDADHFTVNAMTSMYRDDDNPHEDHSFLGRCRMSAPPIGPKVLAIKDLSTMSSMGRDRVGKIMGDLRSVFDEAGYTTYGGNIGEDRKDDINLGLILACTEDGDRFRADSQSLGARTLLCRMAKDMTDFQRRRDASISSVGENKIEKAKRSLTIRASFQQALEDATRWIANDWHPVVRDPDLERSVAILGTLVSSIRTIPLTQRQYTSIPELAFRVRDQLLALADCRSILDGRYEWSDVDYELVTRIARDTPMPEHLKVLRAIYEHTGGVAGAPFAPNAVLESCHVDSTFHRQLRQWTISGLLSHTGGMYSLNSPFSEALRVTRFLEGD